MQPTHKYLSNLTPLRGIAAIWVIFFHFHEVFLQYRLPAHSQLIAKGYVMVDLFFILSGFIISHVYQQSFQAGFSALSFRRFIVARFGRVYPLHFFTLVLLIALIPLMGGWNMIDRPSAIPTNLLLIHSFGIHKIFTWNVPSWSISAEWWAYMVFPFLAIFISRRKGLAMGILTIFAILAYMAIMFWLPRHDPFNPKAVVPHDLNVSFDYGYLRGLAGFISGMLLYKFYEAGLFRKIFQKDIMAIFIIGCALVCLHFGLNDGFYIILFAAVIYVFACNEGKLHLFCNNRIVQYLGKISYSIYMIQFFPSFLIQFKLPGVTYGDHFNTSGFLAGFSYNLIYVFVVIGFASLTYYGIEKPCRKYINAKWEKRRCRFTHRLI